MISFIIGLVGAIVALVGWFGFHSLTALIIGTVLYAIETIMELKDLTASAIGADIVIFVIGAVIGFFIHKPFYIIGMIALAIYSLITSVFGIVTLFGNRRY